MGRVNFNGIVISLQSIVLHGRGNLGEWPLTTALHHSRPQQLPKEFFPLFLLLVCLWFFFIPAHQMFVLGCFIPFPMAPSGLRGCSLLRMRFCLGHLTPIPTRPTRAGWDVFQVSQGEQWQLVAATPWGTEWLSWVWLNPPARTLSQHFPSPAPRHIPKNRGWCTAWRVLRKIQPYSPTSRISGWLQGSKSQCAAPKFIWKLSQTTAFC